MCIIPPWVGTFTHHYKIKKRSLPVVLLQEMAQPDFFREDSPYLDHPLLTPERTAREVDFLLDQVGLQPGARLLDVGCGPGRHAVELARRGYEVVGIDPSPAMIAAARSRAAAAGVSPDFRIQRGEALQAKEEFSAAICLFTTLGQISVDGDNLGLVERVYTALVPGGYFVVEVPQRQWAVGNLKPSDRIDRGERYTIVTRTYDEGEKAITEEFEVHTPLSTRRYVLRYCLFSRTELNEILEQAGFKVQAVFGDYQGSPLDSASPLLLFIARKPVSQLYNFLS